MNLPEKLQKHKQITVLISLSLILTAVDLHTTYVLHGRGYIEWNPFMRYILTSIGSMTFLLINFTLSFLIIVFLAYGSVQKLKGRYRYLPLITYYVIRGSAVGNNLLVMANVL